MKRFNLVTAIFLTIIPLILQGQSFIKMLDSSNVWTIVKHYRTTQHHWSTYKLRLEKDTLTESKDYFKIIRSNILKTAKEVFDKELGFIREDENGNVFFSDDKEKDLLLYSFDVKTGDTITVYNPLSYYEDKQILIVSSIHEMLIDEKIYRKIVLKPICNIKNRTYWIEGIGDLKGLLNNTISGVSCSSNSIVGTSDGIGSEQLSCFEKDHEIIYRNADFEQCIKISDNYFNIEQNDTNK